jgi:sugar/nucleoside kinase (ribokinase family)
MHQPAFEVAAVDTTGAGDAFSGALAWAMAAGAPLDDAVRMAAAAGALATRRLGARASLPDRDELEAFLAAH